MTRVTKDKRKKFDIYPSGRSSDFITPSFGVGCLYDCSYCYMHRYGRDFLSIANNPEDILTAINNHVMFAEVEKPNQTHEKFITYDISCNEDFALHSKHHNWEYIFDFFKSHDKAFGTFATKHIPVNFLEYNPERKIRIRFSLMPQKLSDILEPNTSKVIDRIKAINDFYDAGYDVHVNFSPVIIYRNWMNDYEELFKLLDNTVRKEIKPFVKAEVIFLTHSKKMHKRNIQQGKKQDEFYLWNPDIQESKISELGGLALRYKRGFKSSNINYFKYMMKFTIPWCTIRYIF